MDFVILMKPHPHNIFKLFVLYLGAICLTDEAHQPGVALKVEGEFSTTFTLDWQPVTEQTRRCWNDKEYTTEQAAYAIAFLLILQLTNLTVIERSRKGTGFDYWLGLQNSAPELPFQRMARLEVSGIRKVEERNPYISQFKSTLSTLSSVGWVEERNPYISQFKSTLSTLSRGYNMSRIQSSVRIYAIN